VEGSSLGVKRTLAELDVPRSTFYRWYQAYGEHGPDGLAEPDPSRRCFWNRIPTAEREQVVEIALAKPELTPRELAWHITDAHGWFISESSVYRILKDFDLVTSPAYLVLSAKDRFDQPTRRVHELWQTDFTYFKVVAWGWYYLLTVLDDYSRYIVAWKLFTGMSSGDVKEVLDQAIAATGVDAVEVRHRPRLLSDNGPCFISKELGEYLEARAIAHTRSRPYHPMTQGKIERYHRTLKNVLLLQNHWLPGALEQEIERFVRYYNHDRVHESLHNLTPADVYRGRGREILSARDQLKRQTLRRRERINRGLPVRPEERILPSLYREAVS
jgi:transposase InsO family protein